MKLLTSDLCDAHPELAVAEPVFTDYGGVEDFFGAVVTLKVFEDNAMVRAALEEPGDGRVLVVDGGGSLRCALLGGNLVRLAASNDWRGIVVFGCVRDTLEIRATPVGVKALAAHPRKSEKGLHSGQRGHPLHFAGVSFHEGQWLYADADGLVVSPTALHRTPDAAR